MDKNALMSFCSELSRRAGERAGLEYEIYGVCGDSFECKIVDGQLDLYSVNDFVGVSLRVKVGGKVGYASTTAAEEDGIQTLIDNACSNASVTESPDEQFIYPGSASYTYPKIYDESLSRITPAEKIKTARLLEEQTLACGRGDGEVVRTMGSCVVSEDSARVLINSSGLSLSETSGFIAAYVIPVYRRGGEMNSGFSHRAGFKMSALDTQAIAREAVTEAADFCGARSFGGGAVKTVIHARAMAELLSTFAGIFSSDNTQRGLSLLGGREGQSIASECVTITDDPLRDYGFGSRAFDGEGVASRKNVIIENGVLKTLLYNLKTAKKAGLETTGNGSRASYSSPISVSGTNFTLSPGSLDIEQLTAAASDGIMITSLEGLHSGADAVTGDFSLSAKGYLIENGVKARAVSGITISGNFYSLLKNIEQVGSDMYYEPFGLAVGTPSVLLREAMSVSGEAEAGE